MGKFNEFKEKQFKHFSKRLRCIGQHPMEILRVCERSLKVELIFMPKMYVVKEGDGKNVSECDKDLLRVKFCQFTDIDFFGLVTYLQSECSMSFLPLPIFNSPSKRLCLFEIGLCSWVCKWYAVHFNKDLFLKLNVWHVCMLTLPPSMLNLWINFND